MQHLQNCGAPSVTKGENTVYPSINCIKDYESTYLEQLVPRLVK